MLKKMKSISKSLNQPDERREFKARGHLDVVTLENGTVVGRGVFEPGWKWSEDVKPIAGTDSCLAEHTGYLLTGSMIIRMDSGEEYRIKAGDAFYIKPGHDAWVDGQERCEALDVTGYADYAKPVAKEEAA